ncbi:hypothetical protein H6F42_12610 [Pseudanabaena sp. FACHB-1998]|uniref:hypothetical protein n=1 Tax=Pseudanabaena sp. FACHB-1998 TaxID=2692858 RepID=UPI0016800E7F|nr:hypothetical protein [Pseudanabaena sp. FACHB-1998]MBD2177755.1 hypothetical protein [Pseudanabaena sp. FACHB-1998]
MIWIAIAIHLILSAGLLWASWQIWNVRNALKATIITVNGWTESCENGLRGSSPGLEIAREGVGSTRQQYQALQGQLEKIRKLLSMLGRGVSFLGSRWKQSRQGSTKSVNNKSSGIRSSGSKHNVKRRR